MKIRLSQIREKRPCLCTMAAISVATNKDSRPLHTSKRRWNVVRTAIHCRQLAQSPRGPAWIQLAGHSGNFEAYEDGKIQKKTSKREQQALHHLMSDNLHPFVPKYLGVVLQNNDVYVQMENLLAGYQCPAIMDIKMGVRTYLEEDIAKERQKPSYRGDLYQKMIDVDPHEPTAEEHARRAIDKPRYMKFRERLSSSLLLGFRIEGVKSSGTMIGRTDFKSVRLEAEVTKVLRDFVESDRVIWERFLVRLKEIRQCCLESEFVSTHEIIGTSLLFAADPITQQFGIWIIDFGKSCRLPPGVEIDHKRPWVEGNHEDGYIWGLDNLIRIWSHLYDDS